MFNVEAMVRGYHIYQSVWDAAVDGEVLNCYRELGNIHDPSAVAVRKDAVTVGHIPRAISSVCSIFIRRGGIISCRVNGSRRYSADLPQGGLEIPCILTFQTSNSEFSDKSKKLIEASLAMNIKTLGKYEKMRAEPLDSDPGSSRSMHGVEIKVEEISISGNSDTDLVNRLPGIQTGSSSLSTASIDEPSAKKQCLSDPDIENIIMGAELSDLHINLAQRVLKKQFSHINGLESTLLQGKRNTLTEDMVKNKLQIIHCLERHHWIIASTVKNPSGEVTVMDSIFRSIDEETKLTISNLFRPTGSSNELKIKLIKTQRQKGNKDCGLFAVAMATAITFGKNPSKVTFCQESLRAHLVTCLNKQEFSLFP